MTLNGRVCRLGGRFWRGLGCFVGQGHPSAFPESDAREPLIVGKLQDNQFAVAADYASKMAAISQVTHWFEAAGTFKTELRISLLVSSES